MEFPQNDAPGRPRPRKCPAPGLFHEAVEREWVNNAGMLPRSCPDQYVKRPADKCLRANSSNSILGWSFRPGRSLSKRWGLGARHALFPRTLTFGAQLHPSSVAGCQFPDAALVCFERLHSVSVPQRNRPAVSPPACRVRLLSPVLCTPCKRAFTGPGSRCF